MNVLGLPTSSDHREGLGVALHVLSALADIGRLVDLRIEEQNQELNFSDSRFTSLYGMASDPVARRFFPIAELGAR